MGGREELHSAESTTADVPTPSRVPQARTSSKPSIKLCHPFKRLRLIVSHKSSIPYLSGDPGERKKQLQLSNASSPELAGVPAEGPPARLWWDGATLLIAAFLQEKKNKIAFQFLLLREVLSAHLAQFTG